jgi:hypothetical protein
MAMAWLFDNGFDLVNDDIVIVSYQQSTRCCVVTHIPKDKSLRKPTYFIEEITFKVWCRSNYHADARHELCFGHNTQLIYTTVLYHILGISNISWQTHTCWLYWLIHQHTMRSMNMVKSIARSLLNTIPWHFQMTTKDVLIADYRLFYIWNVDLVWD